VNAVLNTGAAAFIAKRLGSGMRQSESVINLLEQQDTTVADDVATIKCGLDHASPNASKLNSLIGTLWHRRSSVFIGFRYL
jgi:hypothetical protein